MPLNTEQQVFLVFYAIFWGTIGSAQPRWKAFQWPLIGQVAEATHRVWLSFWVLTIAPIVFFGYALWIIGILDYPDCGCSMISVANIMLHGVVPAFAVLGFYRLWIGLVESNPDRYYTPSIDKLDEKYWHTEPTYRTDWKGPDFSKMPESIQRQLMDLPKVDLTPPAARRNLVAACVYIGISALAPWLHFNGIYACRLICR